MDDEGMRFGAAMQAGMDALLKAFVDNGLDPAASLSADWRPRLERRVESAMRDVFPLVGRPRIPGVTDEFVRLHAMTKPARPARRKTPPANR